MRKKSKLLLIAMALGLAFIASASATDFNTTPLDMYPATVPGALGFSFNNSFTTGGTFFEDRYTFDVSGLGARGAANASAAAFSAVVGPPGSPVGLQLRLLAWNGTSYGTILSDSGVTFTPFVEAALPPHVGGAPGHGFYAIEVLVNTPPGALVTQYSGQLQVVVVPEPATYLALLGGLVLVGWQARRGSV